MKVKAGLVTLGDPREEVFKSDVADFVRKERDRFIAVGREAMNVEFIYDERIVRFNNDVPQVVDLMRKQGVESLVFLFPIWGPSQLVAMTASELQIPCAIVTNRRLDSGGLVALTLSGGALDQIGFAHKRFWGDIKDPEMQENLRSFLTAASVLKGLRGQVYGMFGGRTLGMYTAVADPSQWVRLFGVDFVHMDQMTILEEGERIPAKEVERHYRWLRDGVKGFEPDGNYLTEDKLRLQIRCYLATKRLQQKAGFDFVGVKCIPEMSDNHVSQCLTAAFMNDPYDADGPKEPVACACECDMDGALTMQILKLASGGQPTFLMDVRHIDAESQTFVFNNCGGAPTWFAGRSLDAKENLSRVTLRPQKTQGKAGGGATHYTCAEGPGTFARLCRKGGEYRLVTFEGEFVERDANIIDEGLVHATTEIWPHAYVKLPVTPERFIQMFGANHIHGVAGHWNSVLRDFCGLVGIPCVET